ncbi:MAG: hypothetical protein A3G49_04740 [Candidatus Sungbacteria bacterium RIFCSPLOWO2_12_FULL_41_11]|uniref:Four helix bundle protein n=1 Tax=Candidatus Sungbacteria bacterium RIFCSPLOWO2_12_FULL_41_11 TaxID=1802286 RepID=A0A1G2LLT1_9BACT|nr:MAG: 23S rRNA gene intervening protein [Parcubacteria group bacterium GW2011_GWA2_42_14]OHA12587.1 MAG: hypothetical protein A3G49_04740 [Candidatus Sungbacteria bacterium RIFCSPLOWO2_12_FULL_41_11]
MNAGGVDKACKSCDATANYQLPTTNTMTFRFRNFKVYQDAIIAYKFIILITKNFPRDFEHLKAQIRRAALSVILNIAEGSAKNSDKDFNRYLGNSLGSVNEVAACLEVAFQLNLISKEDYIKGNSMYELLANQLGGFSKKLKS